MKVRAGNPVTVYPGDLIIWTDNTVDLVIAAEHPQQWLRDTHEPLPKMINVRSLIHPAHQSRARMSEARISTDKFGNATASTEFAIEEIVVPARVRWKDG